MEIFRNNIIPATRRRKTAGFTMIELLTVLAIASILLLTAMPMYAMMKNNVALSDEAQVLIDLIRTAQNKALTSQGGYNHGIRAVDNGTTECNSGTTVDCFVLYEDTGIVHNVLSEHIVPNGMQISWTANQETTFKKLTGAPVPAVQNTFTIGYPSGATKTVTVDVAGRVTLQ